MFEIIKTVCEEIAKEKFNNTVAYIDKGNDFKFKHRVTTTTDSLTQAIQDIAISVNAKRKESINQDNIIYFHSFSVVVNIDEKLIEIIVEDNFRTQSNNINKLIVE